MLKILPHPAAGGAPIWLDLASPSPEELEAAEAIVGVKLPTRQALSEIENSRRMRSRDGVLFMSAVAPPQAGGTAGSPIGLVLSPDRLVTVRYAPLRGFDAAWDRVEHGEAAPASSLEVFVELCEEIVDRLADALELVAEDLRPQTEAAFGAHDIEGRRPVASNQALRTQLGRVGRIGDRLSDVRDALAGLDRVVDFAARQTNHWPHPSSVAERLQSVARDIASLKDYDAQLFNKIHFLLDATVGLINIAQNDIFKVLTIVSIVGIPPTLIASMYGMNFKSMPEYDWSLGYPYVLALIVLSAAVPVAWFRIKGWF